MNQVDFTITWPLKISSSIFNYLKISQQSPLLSCNPAASFHKVFGNSTKLLSLIQRERGAHGIFSPPWGPHPLHLSERRESQSEINSGIAPPNQRPGKSDAGISVWNRMALLSLRFDIAYSSLLFSFPNRYGWWMDHHVWGRNKHPPHLIILKTPIIVFEIWRCFQESSY